jgi:hypothetical protein
MPPSGGDEGKGGVPTSRRGNGQAVAPSAFGLLVGAEAGVLRHEALRSAGELLDLRVRLRTSVVAVEDPLCLVRESDRTFTDSV